MLNLFFSEDYYRHLPAEPGTALQTDLCICNLGIGYILVYYIIDTLDRCLYCKIKKIMHMHTKPDTRKQ